MPFVKQINRITPSPPVTSSARGRLCHLEYTIQGSQSPGVIFIKKLRLLIPALLKRMSNPPRRMSSSSKALATSSGKVEFYSITPEMAGNSFFTRRLHAASWLDARRCVHLLRENALQLPRDLPLAPRIMKTRLQLNHPWSLVGECIVIAAFDLSCANRRAR